MAPTDHQTAIEADIGYPLHPPTAAWPTAVACVFALLGHHLINMNDMQPRRMAYAIHPDTISDVLPRNDKYAFNAQVVRRETPIHGQFNVSDSKVLDGDQDFPPLLYTVCLNPSGSTQHTPCRPATACVSDKVFVLRLF